MAIPSTPSPVFPQSRSPGIHRSFTFPTRLSGTPTPPQNSRFTDPIEILFESPKCKIVSFSPQQTTSRARAVSLDVGSSSQVLEELPYATATESTLAIGPLRVYRAPSSVAFLESGKLVHPVLPKSACWCVDGKTKFVLGVPGKKYYRIELPCEDEADQAKADNFKVILAQISQYETTRCPFKRGFYVELPESNENTPKRPWRPKHLPGVTSPLSPEGQHTMDEPRIERRFPSTGRESSPSLRKSYRISSDTPEASDNESIHNINPGGIVTAGPSEPRVPKLVATYDEFGLGQALTTTSPLLEVEDNTSDPIVKPIVTQPQPTTPPTDGNLDEVETHGLNGGFRNPAIGQPVEITTHDASNVEQAEQSIVFETGLDETSNPTLSQLTSTHVTHSPSLQSKSDMESLNWLDDGDNDETPVATRPSSGLRSFTAPVFPPLRPETSQSDQLPESHHPIYNNETESLTSIESTSSFHSLHSPTSPVRVVDTLGETSLFPTSSTKSPPNLKIHKRETSTIITNDGSKDASDPDLSTEKWTSFSPLSEDAADDTEASTESDSKSFTTAASPVVLSSSSSPTVEHESRSESPPALIRAKLRSRRSHSPMPSPANIYIPPNSISSHLTNVILNKTASILLGPPVQLVALMLNLARRFRDGSLVVQTYTYGSHGQPIPCEWGDSDLDVDGYSSEEDDYGISIGGTPEKSSREKQPRKRTSKHDRRWDLD